MTYEPSQLPLFASDADDCPASSSDRLPVRTPAPPTPRGEVLTASEPGFSSRPSGSSTRSDLFGHALRTCLASELEAPTGYALNWKHSTTPSGRSWWVLGTPGRRTEGTESGSLLPTCTTFHGGGSLKNIWGGKNGRAKAAAMGLLPTPLAEMGRRTHRGLSRGKANGQRGADLGSVIATAMLPTPVKGDASLAGGRDYASPNRNAGQTLSDVMLGYLPTPTATPYGTNKGGQNPDGRVRPSLQTMLATPTARDWRSGKASEATHGRNSHPLSEQLGQRGLHGTTLLLPIVRWMMGYPPPIGASGSQPTVTPFFPKSQKQSGDR